MELLPSLAPVDPTLSAASTSRFLWAKPQRAHHRRSRLPIDGGHTALCPPYSRYVTLRLARCVARLGLGIHRIETRQHGAVVHLVDDPGFHPFLLRPLGKHMLYEGLRDQHRAVLVDDDDVIRE